MNEQIEQPTQQLSVMPTERVMERGPLSVSQVQSGLKHIQEVMRDCMVDGQDYGKVPGCGDKPGLFQPGAQKLSMMFQLNPAVAQEVVTDYPNLHRGYRLVVRVVSGGKSADGVGECSTMESKYRFRNTNKTCPACGKETVLKSKKAGEGWFCWTKKGGCGQTFAEGSPNARVIESQTSGKVENDNPPDFWNTARKMAFKRAFVHAIINATNTSELWSQDLEDLAGNGVVNAPEAPSERITSPPARPAARPATPSQPELKNTPTPKPSVHVTGWKAVVIPRFIKKYAGQTLGDMADKDLRYWAENFEPKPYNGSISQSDVDLRAALDLALNDLNDATEPDELGLDEIPMGDSN